MELKITEHYSRPFMYLPTAINWILKQQEGIENNDLLIGLNCGIVLNLCSLIESFNKELLIVFISNYLKDSNHNDEFLFERLTDELKIQIENSEWNKQKDLFKKITNNEVKNIIPEPTLRSTNELFKFRNILTHGNKVSLFHSKYNGKSNYRLEPSKFDSLIGYLTEKKLIEKKDKYDSNIFTNSISNKVVNFFILKTNEYLEDAKEYFAVTKEENPELYNLKI